jgi:hypothetical protein
MDCPQADFGPAWLFVVQLPVCESSAKDPVFERNVNKRFINN